MLSFTSTAATRQASTIKVVLFYYVVGLLDADRSCEHYFQKQRRVHISPQLNKKLSRGLLIGDNTALLQRKDSYIFHIKIQTCTIDKTKYCLA